MQKGYVKEHIFNADKTGFFYKDIGKVSYTRSGVFVTRHSQNPNCLYKHSDILSNPVLMVTIENISA